MMRVDNWPARLYEVIERNRQVDFAWGTTDCFCFAADCVLAITGCDFLKDYRGRYSDQETAEQFIAKYGNVEDALGALLEPLAAIETPVLLAQRGDVAVLEINGKLVCGIWEGRFALAPMPNRGLSEVHKEFVKKIWRVS
jgi:hypothetical protein